MSQIVKLNVGGRKFTTTCATLNKSEIFKNMLNDSTINFKERIFIDRSGRIFEHVLGYLRDDRYPFPKIYILELEYFSIPYTVYDKNSDVITKPIHLFCRIDKCNTRCDPEGPSYCKDHKCVISDCVNPHSFDRKYCIHHGK